MFVIYIIYIFARKLLIMEFDNFAVNIDAECASQDFDDVDLYGEIMIEDDNDSNLEFE